MKGGREEKVHVRVRDGICSSLLRVARGVPATEKEEQFTPVFSRCWTQFLMFRLCGKGREGGGREREKERCG